MADKAIHPTREIVTRDEARSHGLKRYFTGGLCRQGHVDERYVRNAECLECVRVRSAKERAENPEKVRAKVRKSFNKRYSEDADYRRSVNERNIKRYHATKHLIVKDDVTIQKELERQRDWFKKQREANTEGAQKIRARKRADHHKRKSDPEYLEKKYAISRRLRQKPEYRAKEQRTKSEWRKNNPEKIRAESNKRRATIKSAEGTHTAADIAEILKRQNHQCPYCAADLNLGYHADHIMPLALGGSNWPENIQATCPPCNLSKGSKHPDDFAKEKARR